MYCPISIDKFIEKIKVDSDYDKKELKKAIIEAVNAKKNNEKCGNCGDIIWAAGTGIVGWNGCFTCITGETDNSKDYEIDEVCY